MTQISNYSIPGCYILYGLYRFFPSKQNRPGNTKHFSVPYDDRLNQTIGPFSVT